MKFRLPVLRPVLLLLLALGAVVVPSPAQAAQCSGSTGVTVLVQYGDGPTQVGCAPGDPDSGYVALTGAGFRISYARGSGAGAICQINGFPALPNGCPSMPTAPNYWAYFQGTSGGAWHYSDVGGAAYDPKPGSVEGWCFGCSQTVPPRTRPPKGAPVTVPTPKTSPTSRPTRKPSGLTPSASPSPSATSSPTTSPTASPSPTPVPSTRGGSPTPQFAEPGPVAGIDQPGQGSGGLSWVWGVALIAVLAAVGGAVALARRRG